MLLFSKYKSGKSEVGAIIDNATSSPKYSPMNPIRGAPIRKDVKLTKATVATFFSLLPDKEAASVIVIG